MTCGSARTIVVAAVREVRERRCTTEAPDRSVGSQRITFLRKREQEGDGSIDVARAALAAQQAASDLELGPAVSGRGDRLQPREGVARVRRGACLVDVQVGEERHAPSFAEVCCCLEACSRSRDVAVVLAHDAEVDVGPSEPSIAGAPLQQLDAPLPLAVLSEGELPA